MQKKKQKNNKASAESAPYKPSKKILEKYADVLVNFALGSGNGIKKGDVVIVQANEYSKPLYAEILKTIWKAGGHVISRYAPDNDAEYNIDKAFFEMAEEHHLDFFPERYTRALVDEADHLIAILCDTNPHALNGIDPKKIMRRCAAFGPYMKWRMEKENQGKFTWTIGLYGSPAMAKEAGLSEKEYWNQIIKSCFLDKKDPIKEWKNISALIDGYKNQLTALEIEKVHILGPDADLWITIGEKRLWNGGGGRNIPSFEIFTSPDWRGTSGWITFNQPLYAYGNLIEGVRLEFRQGRVVKSSATKNEKVLKSMIASQNADKVGEFSLTDKRFSKITKFMANTLFDENMGGANGNTHIALGKSYHDCYHGNPGGINDKEWQRLGFNDSPVHTDIISTAPRTVTAYLKNGSQKIIYKNGQFTL